MGDGFTGQKTQPTVSTEGTKKTYTNNTKCTDTQKAKQIP